MYIILIALTLAAGFFLIARGYQSSSRFEITVGGLVLLSLAAFLALLSFWSEMLWFEELRQAERFWRNTFFYLIMCILGGTFSGLLVHVCTGLMQDVDILVRRTALAIATLWGGLWGLSSWDVASLWFYSVDTGSIDPVFDKDLSFYLFSLPLFDRFYVLMFVIVSVISVTACLNLVPFTQPPRRVISMVDRMPRNDRSYRPLYVCLGLGSLVLAFGKFLSLYRLVYSSFGSVFGAGWVDFHVRRPAYYVLIGSFLITSVYFFTIASSRSLLNRLRFMRTASIVVPLGAIGLFMVLALFIAPLISQWLIVQPNEFERERPYIEHNIKFTRQGFGLHAVQQLPYAYLADLTQELLQQNQTIFSEMPLWDSWAAKAMFQQQQFKPFFSFSDVDVDRYQLAGRKQTVLVAPREISLANLPEGSQTFLHRHFKYIHGYGLVMTSAQHTTTDGAAQFILSGIPLKTPYPELNVKVPQIYYGELTNDYAVVNSRAQARSSGLQDENLHYHGEGGVPLIGWWRRLIFGWTLGGSRLLLSHLLTRHSRIMFHREIKERAWRLAPFLRFDRDPYMVVSEGRLFWLLDAYTVSNYYPYSKPFVAVRDPDEAAEGSQEPSLFRRQRQENHRPKMNAKGRNFSGDLHGINYIRHAVKVVIDAYNGQIDFYVFDESDPIIASWRRVFPSLFKTAESMPASLKDHLRYPRGLLWAQGLVYAKYHITDPLSFYNQEDLWTASFLGSKHGGNGYYILWRPPEYQQPELTFLMPFTSKNRQILVGWLAALSSPSRFGGLFASHDLGKHRIMGPQQVDTKIDQDRYLLAQLNLWGQHGSRVMRGEVLAIPLDDTLLYIEPIYLQSETPRYPRLRLVTVMHKDHLAYGQTLAEALSNLMRRLQMQWKFAEDPNVGAKKFPERQTLQELIMAANIAFDHYLKLLSERRFEEAGRELEVLQMALRDLRIYSSQTSQAH